jgi:Domain of unknown function (DUF4440)
MGLHGAMRGLVVALLLAVLPAGLGQAHPPGAPRSDGEARVEAEILKFREALREAIAAKDVAKLRAMYAESFTHTHGSGKMDGRDTRIVSALAGDPVIETAPADEMDFRIFGTETVIATGRSPILNRQEGRSFDFRWIAVYVRSGGGWQLAASQATRLAPPERARTAN